MNGYSRADQALQTATSDNETLASKSTLCRMEQRVDRQAVVKAYELLWQHLIEQKEKLAEKVSATYRFQYQAHTWKYPS